MTTPLFLCYPKCTTCKKAQKWLDDQSVAVETRDIAKENPTEEELRAWHKASGLPLKKFFNTSGKKYKEQHLKDKLPSMSEDEQLKLLATDGLLVKRPILVSGDSVLVGFKEGDWGERLLGIPKAAGEAKPPRKAAKPARKQKPAQEPQQQEKVSVRAFQIKITLRDMKPAVWRRFFVPEDMTFSQLAEVIRHVMGWKGNHMCAFEMPKSGMNIIAAPWTEEMELGERDGQQVKLTQHLPAEKEFIFVYDMGDNWEHEIVIEDVRDNYPALYAAVLAGEGDCPPDDSGGVWSYMELLAEKDKNRKEWLGKAVPFDMDRVNAALRDIKAGSK